MTTADKTCIYPGCERPAVPPHPLGGPQPSFCDLEEHNALSAHQERERLASRAETKTRRRAMADEAYRAVFLRVHPTGKMVLSLTTDSDGNEPSTRSSSPASSAFRRSTSRSSLRTPTASASATATTRARREGAPAAITSASARIRDKARLLAGAALDASPEALTWSNGALGRRRRHRPRAAQDDRRPRPLRARHRRAAAGRRGRARRADRLPRLTAKFALEHDLDLVGDLQCPEQGGVGLHAPVALRDDGGRAERPVVADREVELDRPGRAGERQVALDAEPAAVGRLRPRSSGT